MTEPCPRLGKWFRGCKFQAVYDSEQSSNALEREIRMQWGISERDKDRLTIKKVYRGTMCVTCGKIVQGESR